MKSENIDWYHPYLLWKVNTGRKRQEEIKSEHKKVKVLLQRAWKEKRTVWRMGEMTKGGKEVWDDLWVGDDYRDWGVRGEMIDGKGKSDETRCWRGHYSGIEMIKFFCQWTRGWSLSSWWNCSQEWCCGTRCGLWMFIRSEVWTLSPQSVRHTDARNWG